MCYANPKDTEVKNRILELYQQGHPPLKIQSLLNLKYVQPVYALLRKEGVFTPLPKTGPRKYHFDESFFSKIDSEEKAYFLGFIAADGCVCKNEPRVRIGIHRKDRAILERLVVAVQGDMLIRDVVRKGGFQQSILDLNSKRMKEDLIRLKVAPCKSLVMTAEVVSHVPEPLLKHFLRGFFDGDGNMFLGRRYRSGIKYSASVIGTRQFLEGSFQAAFPSKVTLKKYSSCDMWHWTLSAKKEVLDFLSWMYVGSTVFLPRKKRVFEDFVASECAHVKPCELLETLT